MRTKHYHFFRNDGTIRCAVKLAPKTIFIRTKNKNGINVVRYTIINNTNLIEQLEKTYRKEPCSLFEFLTVSKD
jgi:uncharacterized membrane protein